MNRAARLSPAILMFSIGLTICGCGGGGGATTTPQSPAPLTPNVTITPASNTLTTLQSLSVAIVVSGSKGTPSGSVVVSSGGYSSASTMLITGSAIISIPAGSLSQGTDTITARYTPDSSGSSTYGNASGTSTVTVTQAQKSATVTVTPEETSLPYAENLIVAASVKDGSTSLSGSVVLSSGAFKSSAATLSSGGATFYIQPGTLAEGVNTLTATYTPDSANSSIYSISTGSANVTLTSPGTSNIAVNINTLSNRHLISPYIYGVNTANKDNISGMSPTLVRFGGNQTSNYNWKLFTYNAGGDWFFEDFDLGGIDSVKLTSDTVNAGSHMLTTIPMLD